MDIETINAISSLPVMAVLIYLLVRQYQQNDKLMLELIRSEREHARNLVELASRGSYCTLRQQEITDEIDTRVNNVTSQYVKG